MSKSNSSSCCSEEDVTGNRKIDEQNELSKADFLGWIAAKCKLLRKNSRTVFEFKALETFSELVASILVKTYESAVKCEEMLYRSVVDEMWTKLEEQNQNDRRGVQDITFIWPFVKEFIDEIFSWKERQQQTKKDFFIRRAFQETKNASPPVLITFASPQLIDDEPNSVKALRKRHSAEGQQSPNSSVIFVESVGGGCSNKVAHVTLRNEERRDENEQPKKRRTEKDAEQPKKKANETPIKQEVIVVDDQQDDVSGKGSKEGTVPTKHMQKADKETEKVPQEKEQQHKERKEDEDEDEIYSLSFGNKSMFEPEEETPSNEPEMEDQQLLKSVKMEPEENDPKENEESRKKGEGEDEEMTAGEEDEEGEEQTDEEEGEVTGSDGTDTPPPFPAKTVTRPYSPIRTPAMNESANQSLSNGAEVTQCKSEHWAEQSVQPQLNTFTAFDAAPCSSSFVDDFNKTPKVSPQKRSEFDFFDQPVTALAKPASPAKNEHRKYSKKVKIRKLKEYQDEQRLRHRLAIGQKTLRFADKISTFSFLIDEGNVKKPSKAKNEGQKSRRHLEGQDFQINNDVRDVVTAVKERSKELLKQQNSYADEDDLATARGDRLVRFSRLLLTDSLLQRLDEDVLKNAYVLRSLEHPRNIELFIDKGLNRNANFLRNSSNLVYFEFSYLFVFYGYDQIVHRPNCVPDPSHFLFLLRHWFVETFLTVDDVKEQIPLMKNCEDENHYYYTPPRIVAVTIPEVGEYAREFRVFNEDLRSFVIANSGCFLLLDWAQMVANCSDVNALDSEEKRMQILALELKCEFGVLIK